jgi:hypothetical protein
MGWTGSPVQALVDANILVKDVVSYTFFDLCRAGVLDLRWTPEIEAEYAEHRGRLRAQKMEPSRAPDASDVVWAKKRMEPIKTHLVPNWLIPGWEVHGNRLEQLWDDPSMRPLLQLPDADDIHVAMAAADWARAATGRGIVLVTDNLIDLPQAVLEPFGITVLHQGDLLEMLYALDPQAIGQSLLITTEGFQNPKFTRDDMIRSVRSSQQFHNNHLADQLEAQWGLEKSTNAAGRKGEQTKTKQPTRKET